MHCDEANWIEMAFNKISIFFPIFFIIFFKEPDGTAFFFRRPSQRPIHLKVDEFIFGKKKKHLKVDNCLRPEFCTKASSTVRCVFAGQQKSICPVRWAQRRPDGHDRQLRKTTVPSRTAFVQISEYKNFLPRVSILTSF